MTYRSFSTPKEVLELIIRRYKGLEGFTAEENQYGM